MAVNDAETLATESGQSAPARIAGPALRCGESVGRYTLLERLGRGGEGTVFSAFDPKLDRRVAVKTLLTANAAPAVAEARALASVSHPNVVGVVDLGRTRGRVWFAMELLGGQTVRAAARAARHGFEDRLRWMLDAGSGLAALHAAGLVHRDIKPENIMLDEGRARIVDLGLARTQPEDVTTMRSQACVDGRISGTARYLAPELLDRRVADAVSDQFSFCLTACEVLFGENPFAAKTVHAQWTRVIDGDFDAPRLRGSHQRRIWKVLRKGLNANRTKRFGSLPALLAALKQASAPSRCWVRTASIAAALLVVVAGSVLQLQRSAEAASTPTPIAEQVHVEADPLPALSRAFDLAVGGEDMVEAQRWLEHGVSLGVEPGTEAEIVEARARAMIAMREGDMESARSGSEVAVALGAQLWGPTDPRTVRDRLALAGLGQFLGAHDDAIAIYIGLLADIEATEQPENLRAMLTHNLAAAYAATGELDAARIMAFQAVDAAIEFDPGLGPDVIYAYTLLGQVLTERGESDDAVRVLRHARALSNAGEMLENGATERDVAYALALLNAGHWQLARDASANAIDDAVARDGAASPRTQSAELALVAVGLRPR